MRKVLEQVDMKTNHNIVVSEILKKILIFDINEKDVQLVKKKVRVTLESETSES